MYTYINYYILPLHLEQLIIYIVYNIIKFAAFFSNINHTLNLKQT